MICSATISGSCASRHRSQTPISRATHAHRYAALPWLRSEGRRILVGSAQTCLLKTGQGRRPSLGRANGDAGMTHLVFRVDAAPTSGTPKRQDKKRAGSSRYYTRGPRRQHRMKTFPDRSSLPLWLAPAVRARPALESLEGPHEENVSQRDSGRGVARSAG